MTEQAYPEAAAYLSKPFQGAALLAAIHAEHV